ncbi:MAG: cyclic 2,3-diphosphoglycerate synthase [Armatimonadota bacterium]|nr:cyclic 2,3-diphosphoglycerate synthase [Armatimonadota bacterium]MDR7439232.1 cyclic 2,3-diphosphoglycerate synthase [Armatimonadota bacterium]MDR7563305.1 cyclic 2,3-diphosphoglycerate synthase [Armatimonadota bacterium]MDR7567379.1 cyclic 2,3-diphosphoglycerate synthase [Armatimonadota bacterium]MDR7602380.1 cyclic 2,3-diphosphoglycerate synthase [Armatimonadota bacterium]
MARTHVLILGAAGRDFHNFNVYYRHRPHYRVVAFTATQIPAIANRRYPPELSGPHYPEGIPIEPEERLEELVRTHQVDEVVFAYSDVSHEHVMHLASRALAAGAGFRILGPRETMLRSDRPVLSVCAVRTGAGKSPTSRYLAALLRELGQRVVVVRHPMPYGDLREQVVQRFASLEDLERASLTLEEREEYEPHLRQGQVVFSGVDYEQVLAAAEQEADVIQWEGGNNDLPFFVPDLHVVVCDPLRPGNELRYHPGEANLRMADVVVINKVSTARREHVEAVRRSVAAINPRARIVEADSVLAVDRPDLLRGRRALVVEDGPTTTHGGMGYGAGYIAARAYEAEIVDPQPAAVGSLREVFAAYPHLQHVLPALGYTSQQLLELEETINRAEADVVVFGTPVDLVRILRRLNKPAVRVTYEIEERTPQLREILEEWLVRVGRLSRTEAAR